MKRWLCLLLLIAACESGPSRDEVLRRLSTQLLISEQQGLSKRMQELSKALSALGPGSDLTAAQHAWRDALLAWERINVIRLGPLVDNGGLLRARFWPVRGGALAQRLHTPPPLDTRQVERMSVDQRGMYALEWQLFVDAHTLRADTPQGTLARAGALAFSHNMESYLDSAQTTLRDGAQVADRLCERSQEAIGRIVNQLVATVDTITDGRFAVVLEMEAAKNIRKSEVVGAPSGSSRELVLAQLRALDRMYRPGNEYGLSALVRSAGKDVDARVRTRLDAALQRVNAIDGPLEVVVTRDRQKLVDAQRALKELEAVIRVDMAAALGVTVMSSDDDES